MTTLSSGHIRDNLEHDLREAVAAALLGEEINGDVVRVADLVVPAVMDCLAGVQVEQQVDDRLDEVQTAIDLLLGEVSERLRRAEAHRDALERRLVQMHGHVDAACPAQR